MEKELKMRNQPSPFLKRKTTLKVIKAHKQQKENLRLGQIKYLKKFDNFKSKTPPNFREDNNYMR